MNTYEKIKEIVVETLDIEADSVKEDSTLASLDLDSLDMVELVAEVEDSFDTQIDDVESIETIADLVEVVDNLVEA